MPTQRKTHRGGGGWCPWSHKMPTQQMSRVRRGRRRRTANDGKACSLEWVGGSDPSPLTVLGLHNPLPACLPSAERAHRGGGVWCPRSQRMPTTTRREGGGQHLQGWRVTSKGGSSRSKGNKNKPQQHKQMSTRTTKRTTNVIMRCGPRVGRTPQIKIQSTNSAIKIEQQK